MRTSYEMPRPVFMRLQRLLQEQVRTGQLRPGDHLPAEKWLCQVFGVNRRAMRHTVKQLEEKGLLQPTTSGPAVAAGFTGTNLLASLQEEYAARGLPVSARLTHLSYFKATADNNAHTGARPGETLIELHRVILQGETPLALHTAFLRETYCEGIDQEMLEEGAYYSVLESMRGTVISHARQTVTAVLADDRRAEALQVSPGSPLLRVLRDTYDIDGDVIEHSDLDYAPDRYQFSMALFR